MGLNEKFFKSADEDGPSFNTVTYEGDGNADRDITGLGFTPDFVWTKNRSTSAEDRKAAGHEASTNAQEAQSRPQ